MQKEKAYWNKWYITLLIVLIVQIILYYFITKHFHE